MIYAYEANLPLNWATLDTGIDDSADTDDEMEPLEKDDEIDGEV